MANSSQIGRRFAVGFVSTLAWLALLIAFLATAATMTVNSMSHVGNTASVIISHLSKNPATIDSLLDEFKKNADPQTVAEIDKNRVTIDSTIASLGGDEAFQDSLAATLNKISEAILNGSSSVTVDFGPLAVAIADKVNATSKTQVISNKELAKIKPQTLDLSQKSKNISGARNKIKGVTLTWLLWLVFLGVLYLLIGWKVLRTAGWHLFSIGFVFLIVRFGVPVVADKILSTSTLPLYQRDLVPQVFNSLTVPIVNLSIVLCLLGLSIAALERLLRERLQARESQIRPSVVA